METQTRTSGSTTATLGLGSVLAGSLPAALMTDHAPDRYTVEAVFTRRPERDEVTEILGSETRRALAKAGYPAVKLAVSDRRLEIENTSLEELRDGLAQVLAARLAEISSEARERQSAARLRFEEAAANERDRSESVAALARSVTFRIGGDDSGHGDAEERAQLDAWTDEGGHGRSART